MTTFAPQAALAPNGVSRQFVRFTAVGVVNMGVALAFYLLFRTVASATVANLVSTVLTTIFGTVANGRVTFRVRGHISVAQHMKSMAVTALGVVMTTVAVNMVAGNATAELIALIVSSSAAGGVRFVLMRHWVFEPGSEPARRPETTGVQSAIVQ